MRTTDDFMDMIIYGKPLPPLDDMELKAPEGFEIKGDTATIKRKLSLEEAITAVCKAYSHYPECICKE